MAELRWPARGAREGRHVADRRAGSWRAHGHSGTLVRGGAAMQLMDNCAPLFKRNFFHYFLRVGLCPTRYLPFAGDVDARQASDSVRTAEIAWTRVHAIFKATRACDRG